jgi:chromosome segregation ATPase
MSGQSDQLPVEFSQFLRSLDGMTPTNRFNATQKMLLDLQGQLNLHKSAKDDLKSKLSVVEKRCNDAEQIAKELRQECRSLTVQLASKDSELSEARDRISSYKAQLEEGARKHTDLQSAQFALQQQLRRANERIAEQGHEADRQLRANAEARRDADAQRGRADALEGALRAAALRRDADERRLAQLAAERDAARRDARIEAEAARRTRRHVLEGLDSASAVAPDLLMAFGPAPAEGYHGAAAASRGR